MKLISKLSDQRKNHLILDRIEELSFDHGSLKGLREVRETCTSLVKELQQQRLIIGLKTIAELLCPSFIICVLASLSRII